jgi:hypothetical protein
VYRRVACALPFQGISQHQDQFKTLADKRSIHGPPSLISFPMASLNT